MDPGEWSDVSVWFIGEMNYVLDCLNFEEYIVRTILKTENISKHKYNQSNMINNMVRAMQSKQYDPW